MKKEYTKRDISKILGRSHRNITYWTDFGLVIPDIQPSQGRGVPRIYSERNLVEFGMIDIMVKDYGISLDSIKYILKILRDGSYERLLQLSFGGKGGKTKQINFNDFYESPEWGGEKDLIYVEDLILIHDGPPQKIKEVINEDHYVVVDDRYYVIGRDFYVKNPGSGWGDIFEEAFELETYGDDEDREWESRGNYMKIIWLSGVRNSALKKVDITLPPYKESTL